MFLPQCVHGSAFSLESFGRPVAVGRLIPAGITLWPS